MLDERLLEILACPSCKKRVVVVDDGKYLACEACKVKYPVDDGIPVMLVDEAVPFGGESDGC